MSLMKIPKNPFPNPYNHPVVWTPFGFFDLKIYGHIILSSDKKYFKIMLWKPLDTNVGFYRGQNKNYPAFMTSWQKLKSPLEQCLGWVQKETFIDWFLNTPYFSHFAYNLEIAEAANVPEGNGAKFCFDFDAIAQHYEFPTNYLDISTRRDVAEFFAYTYQDKQTGEYKPIENFNEYQPHLYSSTASLVLNNPYNKDVKIIGFQPLLRPIRQFAMAINFENITIDYNQEFHKYELPKDKQYAFKIFDKFEGGRELFPEDIATKVANEIKHKAKYQKIIDKNIFNKYCNIFKEDASSIETQLINLGYTFSDNIINITSEQMQLMKLDVKDNLEPWLREHVTYSPNIRN